MKIKQQIGDDKGATCFQVSGAIDEFSDFSGVKADGKVLLLDFNETKSINSPGLKLLILFLRSSRAEAQVIFRNCPTCIIEQVNVIDELRKGARIESFYLPFACDCHDDEILKHVYRTEAMAPEFVRTLNERYPCDRCDRKLTFADDEDLYFGFLATAAA